MTTFLLPARVRFGGQALSVGLARALGRADRTQGEAGERAQLLRHFELLPRGWPVAAITRAFDANDAASATWLRADPAYVRPDINGARLLACGDALRLDASEAEAFLSVLRPLFGDVGMPIDAPRPARWYLRLPREAKVASMASPEEALGADLFDHLPEGPEGRRWRALLSEAHVALQERAMLCGHSIEKESKPYRHCHPQQARLSIKSGQNRGDRHGQHSQNRSHGNSDPGQLAAALHEIVSAACQ